MRERLVQRGTGWVLNLAYATALFSLAPLLAWKAWQIGKYRSGWSAKLWGNVPQRPTSDPCVWLHAVSVGEVNLLATTISRLAAQRPHWKFVVTTTTQSGYELAIRKYGDQHTVSYFPFDFTWAVQRALTRFRPDLLVLAELELWPNLIAAAKRRKTPVAIINGRLGDRSFRGYRRLRPFVRRVLQQVDLIAAQNRETAARFCALGAPEELVVATGSLKYDGAKSDRQHSAALELRRLAAITLDAPVFLAGSTQAPEEACAVAVYRRVRQRHPQLQLILVPRHPERFDEVARLLDASGLAWRRRSELPWREGRKQGRGGEGAAPQDTAAQETEEQGRGGILLVDAVGELSSWWALATVGFVGGSFGNRGGQNMIEPAAYGVATCFGPNTWNFRDIVAQLLNANAACEVSDEAALTAFVSRSLDDPQWAAELGDRARRFVASQQGSTARTVELLLELCGNFDGI